MVCGFQVPFQGKFQQKKRLKLKHKHMRSCMSYSYTSAQKLTYFRVKNMLLFIENY